MSVLQVVGGGGVGGVERVSAVLAQALTERGHRCTHVVLGGPGPISDAARAAGVDVRVLGLPMAGAGARRRAAGLAGGSAALGRLALHGGYDVVQTHLYRSAQLGRPLARRSDALLLGGLHGVDPDVEKRRRMRALVGRLDATVCVSEGLRRHLVDVEGFPAGRLHVVPNGLALSGPLAVPDDGPARRVTSDPEALVIGCIGRLYPRKGQQQLIEAFTDVAPSAPHVHLALVGGGADRQRLEVAARASGVAERVHLVGEQADPGPWLRGFDLLAVPSDFEGFGMVVLEAQRAAVPVVSCALGGPEGLIEDGVSGRQVPRSGLAEALREAIGDPASRRRWAEVARARADRYTADRMADGYLELYETLLEERLSARRAGGPLDG